MASSADNAVHSLPKARVHTTMRVLRLIIWDAVPNHVLPHLKWLHLTLGYCSLNIMQCSKSGFQSTDTNSESVSPHHKWHKAAINW